MQSMTPALFFNVYQAGLRESIQGEILGCVFAGALSGEVVAITCSIAAIFLFVPGLSGLTISAGQGTMGAFFLKEEPNR